MNKKYMLHNIHNIILNVFVLIIHIYIFKKSNYQVIIIKNYTNFNLLYIHIIKHLYNILY